MFEDCHSNSAHRGQDMQQHKIPISAIQEAERVMEDSPTCHTTEVTKVEAMRLLLPQIKAMQAKGYGLSHIAKVLSQTGIAVTEVTLKNYVNRLKAPTEKVSSRRRKPPGTFDRAASNRVQQSSQTQPNLSSDPLVPSASPRRESLGPPGALPPAASPAASSGLMESPRRVLSPAPQESGARRAGFTVRPDTKDI